ncbi:MAG: hypothetical protein L0191_14270, partial [Acidobacteria bacterium]|nr:hypothetical protein [Acidobacteriota bacterium]
GLVLDQFVQVFWTPYDPLDLASGSLDPLGFTRGYLALADRFLPSFTTVTVIPRYTSMLCAALARAQVVWPQDASSSSKLRQERLRAIKSFERAWGLAARDAGIGEQAVRGLRGIRSINRRLDSLSGREKYVTTGSFSLLTNQVRYGGLGVYSTFLDECHLASMQSLSLRPLGERLALAFPDPAQAVHDEDARLSLDDLKEWGIRAHTSDLTDVEGAILAEALLGGEEADHVDCVRWNSLRMLGRLRPRGEYEEGVLLQTLARTLDGGGFDHLKVPESCRAQVSATLHMLEPFETFYQATIFLFDRVRRGGHAGGRGISSRSIARGHSSRGCRGGRAFGLCLAEARCGSKVPIPDGRGGDRKSLERIRYSCPGQ